MEKEQILINAVIATCSRPDSLKKTLEQLARVYLPSNFDKLVVVENGPVMGVQDILSQFPSLPSLYLHEPAANKSIALNHAIEALKGNPLLVFFDDDVLVDLGCLAAYAEAVQKLPERGFFGGPTRAVYEKAPPDWLLNLLPASAKGLNYHEHLGFTYDNITFLGFNWACYRALLLEAGGFDPRFGPGSPTRATGQESQMQARLKEIGVPGYYVPKAVVNHCVTSEMIKVKWVLHRAFRNGIARGLIMTPSMVFNPVTLRRILLRWLYWFSFNIGRTRGILWRLFHHSKKPIPPPDPSDSEKISAQLHERHP